MRSKPLAMAALLAACLVAPLSAIANEAPPAQPGDTITWTNSLEKAFEKAASLKRPVMICINSQRVDGGRVEPAAKGLRDVVYKDPRVVTKSRKFVCVFLTSEGSSGDYGELRARFGISGIITSPQHIFAHPEHKQGDKPLERREYWPYGKGDAAVKALIEMMDKSLAAYEAQLGKPATPSAPQDGGEGPEGPGGDAPPAAPPAPDGDDARTQWIEKLIRMIKTGSATTRKESVASLVTNDKEGDCIDALVALLVELDEDKRQVAVIVDVVRGLGKPGLDKAAIKINDYLKHKDATLRSNAAVTLEYIGCKESVGPLTARVKREKDWIIANHMYRALGRCGAGENSVRSLLLKKASSSKNEDASYGPIVGLAYFHKDKKAARGVEKILKKVGPGGGRRGGGNILRRGMLVWTLAQIEDEKSKKFLIEKMIGPLENTQSWWVGPTRTYYRNAADAAAGDDAKKPEVDEGAQGAVSFAGGTSEIHDDARKDRDQTAFTPKADWEVEARSFGGRGDGRRR